jgi:SAM-dependent methyltransferase
VLALTARERERVIGLVGDLVGARLPAEQSAALMATIEAHVAAAEADDYLFHGVNPARADGDRVWDDARAAAYAPTVGVGAVHLELGTFTTFGQSKVAEMVQGDGLAEFIRLDFDREYRPDLVADVTALPIAGSSIDRVVSNSLFEHVAYPHRIIEETFRVLRPGGLMVVVMPFVWWRHGYPHDYVRLTPQFFQRVCRETGFGEVIVDDDMSSGLYNTLHNASKMAGVEYGRPEYEAMLSIHEAVILLLGALIPADRYFNDSAREWFHCVRVLAVKPGTYEPSRRTRDDRRPLIGRIVDLLADPSTKAPLRLEGRRLVSEFSGLAYEVDEDMAIFTEPRRLERPREPVSELVRKVAREAKRRARNTRA